MSRNPSWTSDEIILALELYFRVNPSHTSKSNPEIIALSELLNKLPVHAQSDTNAEFRNANGVYMKMCNFLRLDPDYSGAGLKAGSKLDEEIWNEFYEGRDRLTKVAKAIRDNYSLQTTTSDLDLEDEFIEGKVLTQTHKIRERNNSVVRKKKDKVIRETGSLKCEVCDFDFFEKYGEIGKGFAECHHTIPVSELKPGDKTKLADLSILCANCHRMIHRVRPLLSVNQLKSTIS